MVASVPELEKRHSGRPKRRASSVSHDDSILRRLGEVRPPRRPLRRGLDDTGVAVPDGTYAVATVEVHVLPPSAS